MKIYTRTGDEGDTSLFGGERLRKDDPRIEAYGTVDELNSVVGFARTSAGQSLDGALERVQMDLFDLGAQLASPSGGDRFTGVSESRIAALEEAIDEMELTLEPLRNFILPGGSTPAATLHLARTVCRRAERLVVGLGDEAPTMLRSIRYLNRLSDYFFVAARFANKTGGVPDVLWKAER